MRISIIAHLKYPIAEPFAGGLEMHTHMLASKLRERGHEVTVYDCFGSDALGSIPICGPTVATDACEQAYQVADAKEHRAYLRIMDEIRCSPPDIVHNNSLHYLPLTMAGVLPVPMVTTLHTPPFEPLAEQVRASAYHAPFIAVSEVLAAEWGKYARIPAVIPNGIDLAKFSYSSRPHERLYAVWYGRIVPEKGLHFAIDAARNANLPLRFAGPLLDRVYFEEAIKPRLGGTDVCYEGHLTHAQLACLIGNASVSICTPCWDEPYGLVVAESLACGVPVAAFARGAIPTILSSVSGSLANPGDVGSLSRAIETAQLLSRRDCRLRAEKVCDVELMIDRYVDLYAQLTGETPSVDLEKLANPPKYAA